MPSTSGEDKSATNSLKMNEKWMKNEPNEWKMNQHFIPKNRTEQKQIENQLNLNKF